MAGVRFGWYIPTHGDGITRDDFEPPSMGLFMRVALAAEKAGFDYALVPVVTTCYEAWVSTAMMSAKTERLKMLVAARPGLIAPTLMAKMVSTFDQLSGGRVYVNLIAGGGTEEMASDGVFLEHDERYELDGRNGRAHEALVGGAGSVQFRREALPGGERGRPAEAAAASAPAVLHRWDFARGARRWGEARLGVPVLGEHAGAGRAGHGGCARKGAGLRARAQIQFGMRMQVLVRETEAEARRDAEALIAGATENQRASRQRAMGNESHADGRMREFAAATAENNYWISRHLYAGLTTIRHGAGVMVVGNPEQVTGR